MKETPIKSVAVVIFRDKEVLLVKNGPSSSHPTGVYGLPAGRVNPGESWIQAAKRECQEETGLRSLKLTKLPTSYKAILPRKDGTTHTYACWSYLCLAYDGSLRATTETEPIWVKVSEIHRLPLVVNVDKMIAEAREFSLKS